MANKYRRKKFTGTFSCGHTDSIYIGGYTSEYRKEIFEDRIKELCPTCTEILKLDERKKELQEALEEAEDSNLPELQGSEAQVQWAVTLRAEFIEEFIKEYDTERKDNNDVLNYILTITSSTYWIEDYREYKLSYLYKNAKNQMEKIEKDKTEQLLSKALEKEQTIIPKDYNNILVEIKLIYNIIFLKTEKNNTFRDIAKSLAYKWDTDDRMWIKELDEYSGDTNDRIVEISNRLLAENFGVILKVDNYENLREKAINGDYDEECMRWISYSEKLNSFLVFFKVWNEELKNEVSKLGGQYNWNLHSRVVPIEKYLAVEDLAYNLNFKFTDLAKLKIEEYKNIINEKVNITEKEIIPKADKLLEILNNEIEIESDLIDD